MGCTQSSLDKRAVDQLPVDAQLAKNPLVGKYEATLTEVYDGDTFTCYFDWNRQRCLVKVRVLGYNSEEISQARYSVLKGKQPRNELERALLDFFAHSQGRKKQIDWRAYADQVHQIDDLLFRRMNALVAKYALIEWMASQGNRFRLELPNLTTSFNRYLGHVTGKDGSDLRHYMIREKFGYVYKTKSVSDEYVYSRQDKIKLYQDFCRLASKHEMGLKGVKISIQEN
jgi:endonuclease YncB( thermonuclease family)